MKKFYLIKFIRVTYKRFLKLRGDPKAISLGLSLGIFIGMTPTLGLQTVIAVFIAVLFKLNKISAALGVWITNPLTAPIIYPINYYIGLFFYKTNTSNNILDYIKEFSIFTLIQKKIEIFWILNIGGFFTGIPLAIIAYYLSYMLISKYREKLNFLHNRN